MLNKQIYNKRRSHFEGGQGDVKNFLILNPCYQRVKKNTQKKSKKRFEKACENKKDSYFCTRIKEEVHTQTGGLNKSKKL